MAELPDGLQPLRKTAIFTQESVPAGLLRDHTTKAGVWGLIHVLDGELRYLVPSTGHDEVLRAGDKGVVEPAVPHRVAPVGKVSFYVEFWR